MVRVLADGVVLHLVGVEDHEVGPIALAQFAAAFEVADVGGRASGREALTGRGFGGTVPT